jgi:hypothetical protein
MEVFMHATLKPRLNITLMAIWAAIAAILSCFGGTVPYITLIFGGLLGALTGNLQLHAMRSSPAMFQQAKNAVDVRHALASTSSGKRSIQLQWAGAAILIGIGLITKDPLRTPIVGYFAFMCIRDVCAFPGIIILNR